MCDTLAIVENGRVLFGKNSDRDPNEAQLLEWHPRRAMPRAALVQCTYLEIPRRARQTRYCSAGRFGCGAEIGANEHGVVIGNEAVFTREPYAKIGLTGMDLLRLASTRHSAEGAWRRSWRSRRRIWPGGRLRPRKSPLYVSQQLHRGRSASRFCPGNGRAITRRRRDQRSP